MRLWLTFLPCSFAAWVALVPAPSFIRQWKKMESTLWCWMLFLGDGVCFESHRFSIMIRVPRSGVDSLLCLSGTDGMYTELRDAEKHTTHPNSQ